MSSCDCQKDQTPVEAFEYLEKQAATSIQSKESQNGLGMFLVPDPETGILEEKVILVNGLSYQEVIKRGQNCVAFKWIPAGLMSSADVLAKRSGQCGQWCGPDRTWCPWWCFCGSGNYCR